MNATHAQRLANLFARTATPTLITSLVTLDAMPPAPEHSWARAKTIEELERRFPAASQAVEDAFDAAGDDGEVDYVAVLIAAIPADQR